MKKLFAALGLVVLFATATTAQTDYETASKTITSNSAFHDQDSPMKFYEIGDELFIKLRNAKSFRTLGSGEIITGLEESAKPCAVAYGKTKKEAWLIFIKPNGEFWHAAYNLETKKVTGVVKD